MLRTGKVIPGHLNISVSLVGDSFDDNFFRINKKKQKKNKKKTKKKLLLIICTG